MANVQYPQQIQPAQQDQQDAAQVADQQQQVVQQDAPQDQAAQQQGQAAQQDPPGAVQEQAEAPQGELEVRYTSYCGWCWKFLMEFYFSLFFYTASLTVIVYSVARFTVLDARGEISLVVFGCGFADPAGVRFHWTL